MYTCIISSVVSRLHVSHRTLQKYIPVDLSANGETVDKIHGNSFGGLLLQKFKGPDCTGYVCSYLLIIMIADHSVLFQIEES